MSQCEVGHDEAAKRFVCKVDGESGYVEYERRDKTLVLTHTVVPKAIGGRGIAGELVQAAMDHARAEELKVDPVCSYAEAWLRRHPDYANLRE